ncbi:FHA domain-containing protein [bacterium]|nr:FHA domain-containing protein [candidate division CSSED10-310 bacterium]
MNLSEKGTPVLEVYDRDTLLARIPFIQKGKNYRLGRDPSNDLVISHEQVSRFHLSIYRGWDDVLTIRDTGSRNGVILNGKRVSGPFEVRSDDDIRIGQLKCLIKGIKTNPIHCLQENALHSSEKSDRIPYCKNPIILLIISGLFLVSTIVLIVSLI